MWKPPPFHSERRGFRLSIKYISSLMLQEPRRVPPSADGEEGQIGLSGGVYVGKTHFPGHKCASESECAQRPASPRKNACILRSVSKFFEDADPLPPFHSERRGFYVLWKCRAFYPEGTASGISSIPLRFGRAGGLTAPLYGVDRVQILVGQAGSKSMLNLTQVPQEADSARGTGIMAAPSPSARSFF